MWKNLFVKQILEMERLRVSLKYDLRRLKRIYLGTLAYYEDRPDEEESRYPTASTPYLTYLAMDPEVSEWLEDLWVFIKWTWGEDCCSYDDIEGYGGLLSYFVDDDCINRLREDDPDDAFVKELIERRKKIKERTDKV